MKHTKFITISSSLLLGSSMLSQAAVTIPGIADFTLSSSTAAGPVHDNLPTAFGDQIAVGDITPTTNSNFGGIFDISNISDGQLDRANNKSWASGQDASVSVTLTFASPISQDWHSTGHGTTATKATTKF